jgi:hypothetical protein
VIEARMKRSSAVKSPQWVLLERKPTKKTVRRSLPRVRRLGRFIGKSEKRESRGRSRLPASVYGR